MTTATVATDGRYRKALDRADQFITVAGEPDTYLVPASDGQGYYRVDAEGCGCPDATRREMVCKHALAVAILRVATVAVQANARRCRRCGEPATGAAGLCGAHVAALADELAI